MKKIPWLNPSNPSFPDPETAFEEPDGLLAAGGSLDPRFMVAAYANGIFPWFSEGEPILWWSPSKRAAIDPVEMEISKSFSKTLRNKPWDVRLDEDFDGMVSLCAEIKREGQPGTWIGPEMREAYSNMHANGLAHSVEVYDGGKLVGGLFGVKLGSMFYGESMASRVPDASKVALAHLCLASDRLGVKLVDCQMMTAHLSTMGAKEIGRLDLRRKIAQLVQGAKPESWKGALEGFDIAAAVAEAKKPKVGIGSQEALPKKSPAP